jgi:competence protein ComEA
MPLLSGRPVDVPSDVLEELGSATRTATEEADQRRRPLGPDEVVDPNRADEVTLDRLPGIGPTTSAAIVAARDSGMVFRQPDDLLVVRGIGPASVERIAGALDFDSPPPRRRGRVPGSTGSRIDRVDLNRADLEELQRLPGVGPALAGRIVAARKEGLFQSVDDLVRVPGIGEATVDRLRGRASVGWRPR